jgi:Cu(I)/Ag(I) efflux system membrane fusion protein
VADGASTTQATDPHAAHDYDEEGTIWTCSMHPQIRSREPGQCPICGMDLIVASRGNTDEESTDPARITLSERAQKLAELRTTQVQRQSGASGAVRLLGRIEPNESSLKTVTAWTGGRIDRLFVNTTGEKVKGGQTIATLYSPEVFAAHQDLITAKKQVERMSQGAESSRRAAEAALSAARQRLSLLGVPDGELARMESQDKPTTSVAIRTPFGGTVMERIASEGTYVTTGARLYTIADLSSLWIQLDAYESDLPLLSLEQEVSIVVESYPGEEFDGRITFIEPTLDPVKRTAQVRVEIENADGRLRPGMFAQAIVATSVDGGTDAPLVIPATAPLFTGRRAIVYVEVPSEAKGVTYEARTVRLGPRLGNKYPVVAGLSEGERIVTRGAFALDADLQIRGGESMMASPDDRQRGMWDEIVHIEAGKLKALAPMFEAYLLIQVALADDDLKAGQAGAKKLTEALVEAEFDASSDAKKAWGEYSKMLGENAEVLTRSQTIEEARKSFEFLSGAIVMILRVLGNPLDRPLHEAHCPMARGSQGGTWIQEGKDVDNPYFGAAMLTCGDITTKIDPAQHLAGPEPPAAQPKARPPGGHNH